MIKGKIRVGGTKVRSIRQISKGAFGSVYLVEDMEKLGQNYALKITLAQNQERYELAEKELRFLREHSAQENPHFIQFIDGEIRNKNGVFMIYLLMEFGQQGTLFNLLA